MKEKLSHFFKTYPTATECHSTSDEFIFTEKHRAESHAATLQDKAVKTHKRGEDKPAKEVKPEAGKPEAAKKDVQKGKPEAAPAEGADQK
jgi:hypothetical protein